MIEDRAGLNQSKGCDNYIANKIGSNSIAKVNRKLSSFYSSRF